MSATRSAELQLARVEASRLLRNPVLWVALAVVGWVTHQTDDAEAVHELLVGYALLVPAFVLMVATAVATRRDRSSGTTELTSTLPIDGARRTVGHGVVAAAAGALGVAATAAIWLYHAPGAVLGSTTGTIPLAIEVPRPNIAQFLQGPLVMVVFCALGVLLATWLPAWFAVVAMFLPATLQLLIFGIWHGTATTAQTWWWPMSTGWVVDGWLGACTEESPCDLAIRGFDTTTPWWHLAYLAALAVLLVSGAMLRHRRDGVAWSAFAVAVTVVATLAAAQAVVFERY